MFNETHNTNTATKRTTVNAAVIGAVAYFFQRFTGTELFGNRLENSMDSF